MNTFRKITRGTTRNQRNAGFLKDAYGRLQETKKRDPAEGAGTENGGDFSHHSGTEKNFRYYLQDSLSK